MKPPQGRLKVPGGHTCALATSGRPIEIRTADVAPPATVKSCLRDIGAGTLACRNCIAARPAARTLKTAMCSSQSVVKLIGHNNARYPHWGNVTAVKAKASQPKTAPLSDHRIHRGHRPSLAEKKTYKFWARSSSICFLTLLLPIPRVAIAGSVGFLATDVRAVSCGRTSASLSRRRSRLGC